MKNLFSLEIFKANTNKVTAIPQTMFEDVENVQQMYVVTEPAPLILNVILGINVVLILL